MFNKRNLVIVMAILVIGVLALSASGVTTRRSVTMSGSVQTNGQSPIEGAELEGIFIYGNYENAEVFSYSSSNGTYSMTAGVMDEYTSFYVRCTIKDNSGNVLQVKESITYSIPQIPGLNPTYSGIDFVIIPTAGDKL